MIKYRITSRPSKTDPTTPYYLLYKKGWLFWNLEDSSFSYKELMSHALADKKEEVIEEFEV